MNWPNFGVYMAKYGLGFWVNQIKVQYKVEKEIVTEKINNFFTRCSDLSQYMKMSCTFYDAATCIPPTDAPK